MNLTNFLNNLSLVGIAATLIFSLPSCNGGSEERGVEDVDDREEVVVNENGPSEEAIAEESSYVNVANERYYDSWDADNDSLINEREWEEGWNTYLTDEEYEAALFSEWDIDGDGYLDEGEFREGIYSYYDADGDIFWNEEEFNGFATNYYYGAWDLDNNDEITEKEFQEAWNTYMADKYDESLYVEWDVNKDEVIDEDEFAEEMFAYWDADRSGFIDRQEYITFYTFQ